MAVKEASTTAQNDPKTVSKGDAATFTGGPVFKSYMAKNADHTKDVACKCRATATNPGSPHPCRLIPWDGKGVYGWADKEDVKQTDSDTKRR